MDNSRTTASGKSNYDDLETRAAMQTERQPQPCTCGAFLKISAEKLTMSNHVPVGPTPQQLNVQIAALAPLGQDEALAEIRQQPIRLAGNGFTMSNRQLR